MAKPPVPDDQLRRQFEELLALPDTDPQAALLRDLLGSVLRLNESRLDMLDLKIAHRSLREMRYAFRAFRPYRDRRKVSIFGSARIPLEEADGRAGGRPQRPCGLAKKPGRSRPRPGPR